MAVLNIDFADFEKLINEVEDAAGRFNSAYSKFQGRSNGTWNEEVNELAKFASPENQAFTYLDRVFQDVESRFESLVKWLRSALQLFQKTDGIQAETYTRLNAKIDAISTYAHRVKPDHMAMRIHPRKLMPVQATTKAM